MAELIERWSSSALVSKVSGQVGPPFSSADCCGTVSLLHGNMISLMLPNLQYSPLTSLVITIYAVTPLWFLFH